MWLTLDLDEDAGGRVDAPPAREDLVSFARSVGLDPDVRLGGGVTG
ncbi:MAG: hypothetical protein HY820_02650 [Acidobacteria bacterium]|nr:hypothetical protein [Acidobacteriota bacterium]